jgi:acid phosphatase
MRKLVWVWVLVWVGVAGGQQPGIDGPPVCPGAATGTASARPGVEAARKTAAEETASADVLVAAEPMENFGVARYRLADYGDCVGTEGCYWRDLDAQFQRAEFALKGEVARHAKGEKLAMVLDIDETTLSSYCEMKREDFGYISPMFNGWVVSPAAAVAIPGTLRLYREARAAGVAIFFLTGRPEEQREATERNLRTAGYEGWAGVVLRNSAEKSMATVAYKSSERKKIVDAGYAVVMSVGDQWSDLMGEPKAAISVKLPNPFYYLP